ncbi:phage Gp37/Gp68 family protein (plasmid) [Paraburkholderia sp. D15]|uniref:phage Gp37/Gp68 family protein n=1 Tax=Paraburkholderia sp. D15 TaxID=2880218 RepID=UPI00247AA8FA|nr:phage Gp37/Gp68 family protein [Paraburkholderia sp. D15]WGS55072.1 phage Gp37/Gp68 family protein [Paraburkholderia sp. D15]
MSENSTIEWTDHTFNTHWGCSKVSPGCDHCYAETLAGRFGTGWGDEAAKREFDETHWNDLLRWDRKAAREGVRRRVFTNSMSDLFDRFAPDGVRARHWEFVARTPNLDHLLLTKRIGNVARMVPAEWLVEGGWPANVWIGASVVNQKEADRDIPKILTLPARVRFLSMEPLLGPVVLRDSWLHELGWVIVGGESGRYARPMHPAWARALRDQCEAAGVPFFFKQWGEWAPIHAVSSESVRAGLSASAVQIVGSGGDGEANANVAVMRRVGKKTAGRLLDEQLYDGLPRAA